MGDPFSAGWVHQQISLRQGKRLMLHGPGNFLLRGRSKQTDRYLHQGLNRTVFGNSNGQSQRLETGLRHAGSEHGTTSPFGGDNVQSAANPARAFSRFVSSDLICLMLLSRVSSCPKSVLLHKAYR